MHVLFITDNFPPEGNAPASRTYEHAVRWVGMGHRVTVITGAPNFPEGRVFAGYKNKWRSREVMDGIDVIRVKTYITSNEGFAKRILDYLSFMVMATVAGVFHKKADIVVATSPQFFTSVAGWVIASLRRMPFVFELRDIWPASITAVGAMEDSLAIRLLERLEMFLYGRADAIVAVTHSFRQELINRGVNEGKISVVLNGVDLRTYAPVERKDAELAAQYGLEGKFVAGYIGTHGMAHALETLVDAANLVEDRPDIVFLFAGGGAAKAELENYIERSGATNIVCIPRQPKEMMPRIWSLCDVSLIHLKNSPLFQTVIPSKIFESMGMGLPIIIGVPDGEATTIVRETNTGIVVVPEDPVSISEAVLKISADHELFQQLRSAGLSAANKYSRDSTASEMETIMLRLSAEADDAQSPAG